MNDTPLYTSKRTPRSLWQQYRIYPDRLELQSWILLHTLKVPTTEITAIELRPSIFKGPQGPLWVLKIDNADFHPYVTLTRRRGFIKKISFAPDDPITFVDICKSILPPA